jgi:hypothetical protein
LEKEGKFKEATTLYVRALKMKPDLDRVLETLEVNGVLYDMNGDVIPQEYQDKVTKRLADFFANEEEDRVRLTEQEREELAKHEHTFDFQLGEEHIKFLEDNGYLVIEVIFAEFLLAGSRGPMCRANVLARVHVDWPSERQPRDLDS